jgi:hypothetical protein
VLEEEAVSDYLDAVGDQVGAGEVSGETLVLLYRAAEEAEQRHDLNELERTLELARRVAEAADEALRTDAGRLIALCEERLAAVREAAGDAGPFSGEIACPGCGRPVAASAVRCRACGTLLD